MFDACRQICKRLEPVAAEMPGASFAEIVESALQRRIPLFAHGYYRTPEIHFNPKTATGKPFHYFAYAAAVSEVEIDGFTGDSRLLRADILEDVGDSLSPLIDRGQIEGGFIQGLGWLTIEELVWDAQGRLATAGASTYKLPSWSGMPAVFNVSFLERATEPGVVMGSKAVGEPPLMLAISVREAIRSAMAAFGSGRHCCARQSGHARADFLGIRDAKAASESAHHPAAGAFASDGTVPRRHLSHAGERLSFGGMRCRACADGGLVIDSGKILACGDSQRFAFNILIATVRDLTEATSCPALSIRISISRKCASLEAWVTHFWIGSMPYPARRSALGRSLLRGHHCARIRPQPGRSRDHHGFGFRLAFRGSDSRSVCGLFLRRPAHCQWTGARGPPLAR